MEGAGPVTLLGLPHRVSVERRLPGTRDAHGNRPRTVLARLANVPARVDPAGGDEPGGSLSDGTVRRFVVILPAAVTVTAHDVIVWEGRRLWVEGPPERFDGAVGPHHVELTAVERAGT